MTKYKLCFLSIGQRGRKRKKGDDSTGVGRDDQNPNKKEKTETKTPKTSIQSNQISQYRDIVKELEDETKTQLEKEEEYRNYTQTVGKKT